MKSITLFIGDVFLLPVIEVSNVIIILERLIQVGKVYDVVIGKKRPSCNLPWLLGQDDNTLDQSCFSSHCPRSQGLQIKYIGC